jgi:hypothetical protein
MDLLEEAMPQSWMAREHPEDGQKDFRRLWFVCFIWLDSFNQINKTNQTNQMNKIDWRTFSASC